MKFISITKSINIRPDWATIGARLKAGTPLDIMGAVANSSAAVGILADDAEKSSAEVAVVTEGSIDLGEIAASYGELTDDCIAAIKGISFIGADGDPIVPSGGGLPDYSEASDGDVLSIENGAPAWKEPSGGGSDLLIVKIAEDETTGNLVADKNYNEISAAVSSGTLVIGVAILQGVEIACDSVMVVNNGATFTGYFSEVSGSSLELTVQKYLLSKGSSGTSYNVAYNEYTFTIS